MSSATEDMVDLCSGLASITAMLSEAKGADPQYMRGWIADIHGIAAQAESKAARLATVVKRLDDDSSAYWRGEVSFVEERMVLAAQVKVLRAEIAVLRAKARLARARRS